jgi:hypothetical protein
MWLHIYNGESKIGGKGGPRACLVKLNIAMLDANGIIIY